MIAFSTLPIEGSEGYRKIPFLQSLGVENIEITWSIGLSLDNRKDFSKISNEILSTGIKIVSSHAPLQTADGKEVDLSSSDDWDRKFAVREVQKSIFAFNALTGGAGGNTVIHCGRKFLSASRKNHLERAAESLGEILDFIENENFKIDLCLENTLPGEVGCCLCDLLYIKEKLKSGRIKFCLDTGHYNIAEKEPQTLSEMSGNIAEVHLHDNSGEKDEHLPPGAGAINWEELFAKIHEYKRLFVFELLDAGGEAVKKCLDFSKEFLDG